MKIIITKLKCKRCLWKWYPKTENIPKVCPHCKSPYWNIERKTKKIKNAN